MSTLSNGANPGGSLRRRNVDSENCNGTATALVNGGLVHNYGDSTRYPGLAAKPLFTLRAADRKWLFPLLFCSAILSLYLLNPDQSNPVTPLLFLSYPLLEDTGDVPIHYGKGARDFAFVAYYTIFLTFTREFIMEKVLQPLAVASGLQRRSKQARFKEQVYTAMYHGGMSIYGFYVMTKTPLWYFDTKAMFDSYPHRTHMATFKAFYLLQASYWAQQMLVMIAGLEKPRKDFKELVAHHIITLSLIWLSYRFHFTYVGLGVFITHDASDFFFATSKTLNYLDSPLVGPYFGAFIAVWIYTRHYLNLRILMTFLPLPLPGLLRWANSILHRWGFPSNTRFSTQALFPSWTAQFAAVGPNELNWETQHYKFWVSQWIGFTLLATLQGLNLFWLFLIFRVAYRFIFDSFLEDERSETERARMTRTNMSRWRRFTDRRFSINGDRLVEPAQTRLAIAQLQKSLD